MICRSWSSSPEMVGVVTTRGARWCSARIISTLGALDTGWMCEIVTLWANRTDLRKIPWKRLQVQSPENPPHGYRQPLKGHKDFENRYQDESKNPLKCLEFVARFSAFRGGSS